MKYSIIFLIVIVSCSITVNPVVPRVSLWSGYEFKKYSDKGFLFTPYSYHKNYESIGLFEFKIYPKHSLYEIDRSKQVKSKGLFGLETKKEDLPNKLYTESDGPVSKSENAFKTKFLWFPEKIDADSILNFAYQNCVKLGANALVDLEINAIEFTTTDGPIHTLYGIELTGFAIKRLDDFIID